MDPLYRDVSTFVTKDDRVVIRSKEVLTDAPSSSWTPVEFYVIWTNVDTEEQKAFRVSKNITEAKGWFRRIIGEL